MRRLQQKQWVEISASLEDHHSIFNELWQIGRPRFIDEIPTAAISFSNDGDFLEFLFNPDFWDTLNDYERLFVIAHECLHVILNHGYRTTGSSDPSRTNHALDIVVNHLLVTSFGFDRSKISNAENLCWVDTVFKNDPNLDQIPTDESFEYYYPKTPTSINEDIYTVDDHSKMGKDASKIIKKINDKLSSEEKLTIKEVIEDNLSCVGDDLGGWTFIDVKIVVKRKWETIIQKWSLKYLRANNEEIEQWARVQRRFELLQNDLFLPSEMEDEKPEKDRLPVFLFLDTSGSCWGLKDRFFAAGLSLPPDRFDVRLFCFDTKVKETTLESGKIYGGGGTRFDIIEMHIQKLVTEEKIKYPEAVFLITDGFGNKVAPENGDRWHWFLTKGSSKSCIPKESKVFDLNDFE